MIFQLQLRTTRSWLGITRVITTMERLWVLLGRARVLLEALMFLMEVTKSKFKRMEQVWVETVHGMKFQWNSGLKLLQTRGTREFYGSMHPATQILSDIELIFVPEALTSRYLGMSTLLLGHILYIVRGLMVVAIGIMLLLRISLV